ncbi:hypothetical protein VOLCADRAFT_88366 [Volvox carteri f. nagariensis]|uniref:Uncharacterized protein n=1 Tax=Volvox carteri f. nagariensis TaxID=3068 RepID=D8TN63_VOLCA|nr:uncharacterized protein VOLCADRAFT_88366 [Volvox carteri f. nagariensis]EFJ51085.1 hypothetical protein VOLCADRAFT_88366 [Volvox carteri f. nagariensis]|eukprot:XP_002948097.1 hypothetical protein VOLCADRAFT_88366 [Volvox carteri f. nagariensis]
MSADYSYDEFIAQLERKHQQEAPGHNSYFEVFTEASRLIGQLKKGLNVSIHRERQSEVRVAAQSWQDSSYNERADNAGVDILDWQPRFAHLSHADGGGGSSGSGTAGAATAASSKRPSKSAIAGSPTHQQTGGGGGGSGSLHQRRSNTSPPVRRPGGHAATTAAATTASGELPSPAGPAAAAQLTAADRAANDPMVPPLRSPQRYSAGVGTAADATTAPRYGRHVSAGRASPGPRRATDSAALEARGPGPAPPGVKDVRAPGAGPSPRRGEGGRRQRPQLQVQLQVPEREEGQLQLQQQQQREDAEEDPEDLVGTGGRGEEGNEEDKLLGTRQRSLPDIAVQPQLPRLPPLDESPGPPVLLSPTALLEGASRADEAIRVFARTAYEPGERRHTLMLSLGGWGAGLGGTAGEGGDSRGLLEPLPLAPVPRAVPRRVTEALSSLALPLGLRGSVGLSTEGLRVRPSGGSFTAAGGITGGGGDAPISPLPLPLRSPRRISLGAAAAGGGTTAYARPSGGSGSSLSAGVGGGGGGGAGAGTVTSPGSQLPAAGIRTARESYAGAGLGGGGGGGGAAGRISIVGGGSISGEAAAASGAPGGLIRGYVGGGALDHRVLDAVPRLGLDAPRLRSGSIAVTATATTAATADTSSGSSGALRPSRPGTAQPCAAAAAAAGGGGAGAGGGGDSGPAATGVRFARSRRASCTGVPAAGASGGSISLGPMLVTREQVDSYVVAQMGPQTRAAAGQQGQGQGNKRASIASGRPGHNVIGTRGCLTDDPEPRGVQRALRREVGGISDASGAGAGKPS